MASLRSRKTRYSEAPSKMVEKVLEKAPFPLVGFNLLEDGLRDALDPRGNT